MTELVARFIGQRRLILAIAGVMVLIGIAAWNGMIRQ